MTITLRGKAHAESDIVHSVDVTVPSGVVDGDLLVVFIIQDKPDGTLTADTGTWIEFAAPTGVTTMSVRAFYRIADSEPTPGSGTWTFSSGSGAAFTGFCAQVSVFFETSGEVTWVLEDEQFDRVASGNTLNTTSITGVANSLYIFGSCNDDDENITTDPTGPTKIFEVGGSSAPDGTMASASLASWFELVNAGGITDSYTWGGGTEEITNHAAIFSWSDSDTFTGTAAITVGSTAVTATGTSVVPIYAGTAAIAVGSVAVAASGRSLIYIGASAITVGSIAVAASGTSVIPVYAATPAITIGSIAIAASGTSVVPVYTATSAIAVGSIIVSASGTFTVPVYTATAAITIGSIAVAASGTFVAPAGTNVLAVIPRNARPSYKSKYAHSPSESDNSEDWKGLVGLWAPALGQTGLTLRDLSGYGNDGVLTGMDVGADWGLTGSNKIPGHALTFDGTGDERVIMPHSEVYDFDSLGQFSTECWIRMGTATQTTTQIWISKWNGSSVGWQMSVAGGNTGDPWNIFLRAGVGNAMNKLFDRRSLDTEWHHVVTTWEDVGSQDEAGALFYEDGRLSDTDVVPSNSLSSLLANDGNLQLGIRKLVDGPFDGSIAYAAVYNRVLSPTEIKKRYDDSLALLRRKSLVISIPAAVGDTFTATAAIAIGSTAVSAAATSTVPVYAATAAIAIGGTVIAASGTSTVPVYVATSVITVGSIAVSASGIFATAIFEATSAIVVGSTAVSASGTSTVPIYAATSAITVSSIVVSASGVFATVLFEATSAIAIGSTAVSASGTSVVPIYAATSGITVGSTVVAASGTLVVPIYTATSAITVGSIIVSASGTFTVDTSTATSAITVGSIAVSATGTSVIPVYTATSAIIVGSVAVTATGTFVTVLHLGQVAITIGSIAVAAAGTFATIHTASAVVAVGSVVVASSGTLVVPVYTATSVAISVGSIVVSASGTQGISGDHFATASIVIGGVDITAVAHSIPPLTDSPVLETLDVVPFLETIVVDAVAEFK